MYMYLLYSCAKLNALHIAYKGTVVSTAQLVISTNECIQHMKDEISS